MENFQILQETKVTYENDTFTIYHIGGYGKQYIQITSETLPDVIVTCAIDGSKPSHCAYDPYFGAEETYSNFTDHKATCQNIVKQYQPHILGDMNAPQEDGYLIHII